jgi:hypothetical protein
MPAEMGLNELKAFIRQQAGIEAAALESQFAEKGLGFISPPQQSKTKTTISGQKYRGGRGGEWDFYSNLSKVEKNRIRRKWTSPSGMQPDQFGIDDSITGQFRSVDEGVEEFLDLTRRIDVLKRYANTGKLPSNMDAYGGLNLDSIFSGAVASIEMDMRVPISVSALYGENSLEYLSGLNADSALAYAENPIGYVKGSVADPNAKPAYTMDEIEQLRAEIKARRMGGEVEFVPRTQAQIKLQKIQIAKQTKLNDIASREAKTQSTLRAGKPVPQRTAQTQAQINLEAAKARGMAAGPVNEAAEYALKDAAGYFDDGYFNTMSESAAYVDDVIPEYEALDGPIASIVSSAKTAGASRGASAASAVAGKAPAASSTTSHIIKGVETATDLVSFNKKTAAAAAGLGLAGGYFANRKRTRR